MRPRHGDIAIGIVNNMPDAALESTERQFIGLLAAASGKTPVRVRLFALPGVPRGEAAQRHIASNYAGIEELWNAKLDGLIVTGTEPRGPLTGEPYWPAFTRLVDWADAEHRFVDVVVPCGPCRGAASRRRRSLAVSRQMLRHLPMPADRGPRAHSRSAGAMAGAAFALERSAGEGAGGLRLRRAVARERDRRRHVRQGVQAACSCSCKAIRNTSRRRSVREYRRDVGRYLRRERDTYPAQPQHYFDPATSRALDVFRTQAIVSRTENRSETAAKLPGHLDAHAAHGVLACLRGAVLSQLACRHRGAAREADGPQAGAGCGRAENRARPTSRIAPPPCRRGRRGAGAAGP